MNSQGIPIPGEWPCQTPPAPDVPPRLVALLYRLLRDGHVAPGDLEQVCIDIERIEADDTAYTNGHLEGYSRSIATFITDVNHDGSRRLGSRVPSPKS